MNRFTFSMVAGALAVGAYVTGCASGTPAPKTADAPPAAPGAPGEHARGPHHAPPPESLAACEKLADDAACKVTLPAHKLDGTCRALPEGGALACAPKDHPMGPPPDHGAHGDKDGKHARVPQEAIDACAKLAADAGCTVSIPERTFEGTCHRGPDGAKSACMPKDMPHHGPHGGPPGAGGPPPGAPPGPPPGAPPPPAK